MTQPAGPIPPRIPEYQSGGFKAPFERRERRPFAISEIISWLVILLVIIATLVIPLILKSRAAALPAEVDSEGPDVQLLLQARYVVGVNSLMSLKSSGQTGAMIESLAAAAKTPADRLRIAILKAELEDPAAVSDDLERLARRYPSLNPDIQTLQNLWASNLSRESPTWKQFRIRHGWFADLAASQGKPAADPLRVATLNASLRTVAALVAGVLIALGLMVVGLGLLIWASILFFSKRMRLRFNQSAALPSDRRAYVQGVALYLGSYVAAGFVIKLILLLLPRTGPGLWGAMALPAAFILGVSWPKLRGQTWPQWRAALGLHTGTGVFREIIAGAAGYVAGLPLLGLGALITLGLSKLTGIDASHPIVNELSGPPLEIAIIVLLACVYAPITEELMFRGALFAHLRERFGFWISGAGVAVVFAIIHPQGWTALPVLGTLAVTLAAIREWRGSILPCMVAHAINNSAVMALVLLSVS